MTHNSERILRVWNKKQLSDNLNYFSAYNSVWRSGVVYYIEFWEYVGNISENYFKLIVVFLIHVLFLMVHCNASFFFIPLKKTMRILRRVDRNCFHKFYPFSKMHTYFSLFWISALFSVFSYPVQKTKCIIIISYLGI